MSAGAGGFTSRDGYRLAYRSCGDGPRTLICVHGLYRNGHDFDFLAEGLADGFRVVMPDMIGRGESDYATEPDRYNTEHYVRDIQALAEHLGLERYAYLGTSMGGMIGMALAAQADSGVERLILNDVGPEIALSTLKEIGARSLDAPQSFDGLEAAREYFRRATEAWGGLNAEQLEHVTRHSTRARDGRLEFHYDRELIKGFRWPPGDVDLWPLYRQIRCPVLVLRGAESEVLSAATADKLRREPQTQVIEIPATGHAPHLMSPEQIAYVRRFLQA